MEPNSYTYPTYQGQEPDNFRRLKIVAVVILAVICLIVVYAVFKSTRFRVVSTNPTATAVAAISPFLDITFNKDLSDKSVSVSISPDALSSYTVKGKTLDISLNTPLDTSKTYTVTIGSVTSVNGDQLTDKKLTFKPQNIAFDQLPADQQAAIKKEEPPVADQDVAPTFEGTGGFLSQGLTTDQLNEVIQAFTTFSPHAKQIAFDTNSISPGPHDPNTSPAFTLNFNVTVDTTAYKGLITYADPESLAVQLYNPQSNAQVFDSGLLTSGS